MRTWTAVKLALPPPLEDRIILALHDAATLGIEIVEGEDRTKVAGGEGEGKTRGGAGVPSATAYFPRGTDLAPLLRSLAAIDPGVCLAIEEVRDEPWVERQRRSRPLAVGNSFVILQRPPGGRRAALAPREGKRTPAGRSASASRGTTPSARTGGAPRREPTLLVIPPRRAFGTGEHTSTRLCLELLEGREVDGKRVLDFGTGTGILAIAAAAKGAGRVVAIDNDPEAIEMARENIALNRMSPRDPPIDLRQGDLACAEGPFDLILANLFSGALEAASEAFAARQPRGGAVIASGFAPEEAEGLARVFAAAGYAELERRREGEWAALVMEKA